MVEVVVDLYDVIAVFGMVVVDHHGVQVVAVTLVRGVTQPPWGMCAVRPPMSTGRCTVSLGMGTEVLPRFQLPPVFCCGCHCCCGVCCGCHCCCGACWGCHCCCGACCGCHCCCGACWGATAAAAPVAMPLLLRCLLRVPLLLWRRSRMPLLLRCVIGLLRRRSVVDRCGHRTLDREVRRSGGGNPCRGAQGAHGGHSHQGALEQPLPPRFSRRVCSAGASPAGRATEGHLFAWERAGRLVRKRAGDGVTAAVGGRGNLCDHDAHSTRRASKP